MAENPSAIREVVDMYRSRPFPQWTKSERERRFFTELIRYRCLGLERAMEGARFLDVGCGTGNRSMLAAKHFGVAEFVGLDATPESLEVAKGVAAEEDFSRFTPVHGDLFDMPFETRSFDVVVSWGVLHHTPDPFRGLQEMVRVCRPGGYIGVFLYNKWNHWRHNLQKARVGRLAGDDVHERFRVAHTLYGTKPVQELSPEEVAYFYDKYCHPHKSDHTIGETLDWFDKLGLDYAGSYPPLRFGDLTGAARYALDLAEERPSNARYGRLLRTLAGLPYRGSSSDSFQRPSGIHRAVWSLVYLWMGRSGAYSGGAALSARKAR